MLEFQFDRALENLDIYLLKDSKINNQIINKGTLLGHTDKPRLTKDYKKIKSENGLFKELIKKLFGPGKVVVKYDEFPITWVSKGLFPPSIDSTFLMKTLKEHYSNNEYNKIIDVGTGTGVIGLYLLKNNPNIKSAILTDYQNQAAIDVGLNAKINNLEDKIEFIKGNGLSVKLPRADLIISNPPYIPETPGMKKARKEKVNPYQGTDLIENLIKNYSKTGSELLLQVSSICEKEVKEFNEKYNENPEEVITINVSARFTFLQPEHREYLVNSKKISVNNTEEFIEKSTDNNQWPMHELIILKYKSN